MFFIFGLPSLVIGLLLTIYVVAMFACMASESTIGATISSIVTAAIVVLFAGFNPIPFLLHHPILDGLAVVGYVVAGIAWAVAKWSIFSLRALRKYESDRASFLHRNGYNESALTAEELAGAMKNFSSYARSTAKPLAANNKSKITTWMMWWPFSFVWTILDDPVRKFFNAIFAWLRGMFQQITDRIFAKYAADLKD